MQEGAPCERKRGAAGLLGSACGVDSAVSGVVGRNMLWLLHSPELTIVVKVPALGTHSCSNTLDVTERQL